LLIKFSLAPCRSPGADDTDPIPSLRVSHPLIRPHGERRPASRSAPRLRSEPDPGRWLTAGLPGRWQLR
jgi:hypothetical protein